MATCEWCGREFEDYPPYKPFCSRKCEAEDPNAPELIRKYEWRKSPEGMQFAQEREEEEKAREREREENLKEIRRAREEEEKAREEERQKKGKAQDERACGGCCIMPVLLIAMLGGIGKWMEQNSASHKDVLFLTLATILLIFVSIWWGCGPLRKGPSA